MAELTSQLSLEKSHLVTLHLISLMTLMTNDQQINYVVVSKSNTKRNA
jgi:hypothetical protein